MGTPAAQRQKEYLAMLKAKNDDIIWKKKEKEKEAGSKSWKMSKTATKCFCRRTN